MALATATITFNLAQLLGADFTPGRVRAYVATNVISQTLIDTSTNQMRLGDQLVDVSDTGGGTWTTWVPGADGNPITWQETLVVTYPRAGRQDRLVRTFGPYTITGDADLADLEVEQAVPAEYLTVATAEIQGYVEQAKAYRDEINALTITDLGTSDGQLSTLLANPTSASRAASLQVFTDELLPLVVMGVI